MKRLKIILISLILSGCASVAENWKLQEGEMICIQKLKLKGIGDREVKFEDKSEASTKSPKWFPDIQIEDLRTD